MNITKNLKIINLECKKNSNCKKCKYKDICKKYFLSGLPSKEALKEFENLNL